MTVLEIMKMNKEYCLRYDEIPNELQIKAKTLCWEYNQCSPMEDEKRKEILEKLLGTYHHLTHIAKLYKEILDKKKGASTLVPAPCCFFIYFHF